MPGPAIHHLIAQRLRSEIFANRGLGPSVGMSEYTALQALLSDPKNDPYLFVGCHGPDPFFFNTKDLDPTLGKFVEIYNDIADFLRDFEQALLSVVPQPVLDALAAFDEALNEVIDSSVLLSELQQTFNDINTALTALLDTLIEGIKRFVTEFNLFDRIEHPYRDGANEGQWWFDAMHYRKTGKFTEAMLEASRDLSSPTHLYALGYLTHVAGDTVGHAYVNLWSGGAYRSAAQRHKTGENFQDVFNLLAHTGQDFNFSRFHHLYNFNYQGTSTPPPADNPRLPDDLAQFLADIMNKVYQEDSDDEPDYASKISPSDIDDTYRLWYRFMKGFTETGTLPPPVPYSLTAELREAWEKTMDNLDDIGDFIEGAVDTAGKFSILGIFIVLAALALAAVAAAAALADLIAGSLATLGTATIRYAACLIYEQVYNAFQSFRLALTFNGLGFPMVQHLAEPRLRQFIQPDLVDPTGVRAADVAGQEPLLRFTTDFLSDPVAAIFHQERHLIYPITDGEKIATSQAPFSYFSQSALFPAFGRIPLSDSVLELLAQFQQAGSLTEADLRQLLTQHSLGNAVALTEAMYDRWFSGALLPDFNLDSDRGYGYLCWRQPDDPPNEPKVLKTNTSAADPTTVTLEVLR